MDKSAAHFVLIHGACHGAWCWYKVVTLLRSSGHRVTAIDMASCGVNPQKLSELHSVVDEFAPLMDFMADLPHDPQQKVVLVGHSKGGIGICMAMEKFPDKIAVAVFVAACMYGPDLSLSTVSQKYKSFQKDLMDCQLTYGDGPENPPTSVLVGPKFLASYLYQLSPPEDLTLATLLVRPENVYGEGEPPKETEVTKENYGSVGRVFMLTEKDNMSKEEMQMWMIENNPPDEVLILTDADHMAMFSKPQLLCSFLQQIAYKWLKY